MNRTIFTVIFFTLCCTVFFCSAPELTDAASFDCAKARTQVELNICGNEELSTLDGQLGQAYKEVLSRASDKDAVKRDQREWITLRNHLTDVNGLIGLYQARIATFHAMVESSSNGQQRPAASTVVQTPQPAQSSPAIQETPIPQQLPPPQEQTATPQQKQAEEPQKSVKADEPQSTPSTPSAPVEDHGWRNFFIVFGIMVIFIITGIILHQNNTINVFVDYTDAVMSLAAVAVPPITYFAMGFFTKNDFLIKGVPILLFILLVFFPVKAAFIYSRDTKLGILTLLCKLSIAITYLICLVAVLISGDTGKQQDDETGAEYLVRMAREKARMALWLAVLHGIYVFIMRSTTRFPEFSDEIFNLKFNNCYGEYMRRVAGHEVV